jgi:lipopolysaccharide transport system ATP-binding protein
MKTDRAAPIVEAHGLSKIYRVYDTPGKRMRELLSGGRRQYGREVRALDDVSFTLSRGDRLGIVGENGSGKSTLLKILTGVLTPTSGTVAVKGRVAALLELGAGFNPDLSGVENIAQFCRLHGMPEAAIPAAVEEISRFSELGPALNSPIKIYSSGMGVRLGFSCAVYVKPDVLIVDEALSVGDAYFQNKCLHKIRAMLDEGVTFLYVTHSPDAIRSLCNVGLWLDGGRTRLFGPSKEVGGAYQAQMFGKMARAGLPVPGSSDPLSEPMPDGAPQNASLSQTPSRERSNAFAERVAPLRSGSGEVRITDIVLVDQDGNEADYIHFGGRLRIKVFFKSLKALDSAANIGVGIYDTRGVEVLHFSSATALVFANDVQAGSSGVIDITFQNILCPGEFGINAGVGILQDNPGQAGQKIVEKVIDYCPAGTRFSILSPDDGMDRNLWGLVHTPYDVRLTILDRV